MYSVAILFVMDKRWIQIFEKRITDTPTLSAMHFASELQKSRTFVDQEMVSGR